MSGASNPRPRNSAEQQPPFLTTREVADLLRVKERKVYDLAAANEIPHRRITVKLLFPAAEIMAWIDGGSDAAPAERPAVLTGSHDPLPDWAIRESGSELATLWNGSLDGLQVFAEGRAALAGLHVPEGGGWNVETEAAGGLRGGVLITWAARARGLLIAPSLQGRVPRFSDIRGHRVVRRQPGAGAAALLDALMAEAGMAPETRRTVRQARAKPLVEAFAVWLAGARARVSARSRMGEKLAYFANHWKGLTVFLDDGRVEMDSNAVENMIRPLTLQRKNSLFAGHDEGAANWARIASLIETCKINGVDPFAYLVATLEAIAAGHPQSRIDDLTPWAYAKASSGNA